MPLPSGLENFDAQAQGWDAVLNTDIGLLDTKLVSPMTSTKVMGTDPVVDAAAATAQLLTDSSGGTAGQTIGAVSGSGADATINNNFASLTDEVEKLRADNAELRTKLNSLLAALRKTGGCGVIND